MIGLASVNYNQYKLTYEFLDSLATVKNAEDLSVYIADVSTKKETFVINKNYPMKVIVEPLNNFGYAYGINMGIKYFIKNGLDKFCAINNDIFFDRSFSIQAHAGFKKANIFGGKIYYAKGYEYHKKYQNKDLGKVLWYAGGKNDWKNVYISHRGVDEVDKKQYDKFEETDFITGCMLFFDKKVINSVGYWDERYFLYFEDSDFCERAKKKGFRLYYDPKVVIYHKNSQSTGGSGSPFQVKYQNRNRLIFGLKFAPLNTKLHLLKNYFLKK